jgi:AraC-like DNA-binding protein
LDPLTEIIRVLRPQTVLLGRLAAAGEWAVLMPQQQGPVFHLVMSGRCWFEADGSAPIELQAGDYVLSTRPIADRSSSAPGVAAQLSDAAFKARHSVDGELCLGDLSAGPVTRTLGGLILCEPGNAELLITLLPRVVHVRAAEQASTRLRTLIDLIRDESIGPHPGRDAVLARLIEVLLIETLRRPGSAVLPGSGVLGALADAQLARALGLIHGDVGRGWTVPELARAAGMSRSVFARRFTEVVGSAPVEYLLDWRMALAKDALLHGGATLDEIAVAVGYKSASAFSTAFSQRVGCPPSAYRARRRFAEEAADQS